MGSLRGNQGRNSGHRYRNPVDDVLRSGQTTHSFSKYGSLTAPKSNKDLSMKGKGGA